MKVRITADEHPMIIAHRKEIKNVESKIRWYKDHEQWEAARDQQKHLDQLRYDLKEAYMYLHKAGWK